MLGGRSYPMFLLLTSSVQGSYVFFVCVFIHTLCMRIHTYAHSYTHAVYAYAYTYIYTNEDTRMHVGVCDAELSYRLFK